VFCSSVFFTHLERAHKDFSLAVLAQQPTYLRQKQSQPRRINVYAKLFFAVLLVALKNAVLYTKRRENS